MSLAENLAFRSFDENGGAKPAFWTSNGAIARKATTPISALNIKTSSAAARISSLSGGNLQRMVLARELTGDVALLRYAPAASMPRHRHLGLEAILVLSGTQSDEMGTQAIRSLVFDQAGSVHPVWSDPLCVVLIQWARQGEFV
jgi:hypothetical protein